MPTLRISGRNVNVPVALERDDDRFRVLVGGQEVPGVQNIEIMTSAYDVTALEDTWRQSVRGTQRLRVAFEVDNPYDLGDFANNREGPHVMSIPKKRKSPSKVKSVEEKLPKRLITVE